MDWRRIRKWICVVAGIGTAILLIASWVLGGMLIASANRPVGSPPTDFPAQAITIASHSGSTLAAWYLQVPDAEATVLLLHPIRSDRRSMLSRAKLFHQRGYSTLLVDMQGHGESQGENITIGHLEKHDVAACVQHIQSVSPNNKIAIVGWSLGGAAALLSNSKVDVLVLESVYPNVTQAIHNRVEMRLGFLHHIVGPLLVYQLNPRLGISPDDLSPIQQLQNLSCPVLVTSGSEDLHTTVDETRRIFEAAKEPKQLVVFDGASHEDLLAFDPKKYEQEVLGFMEASLGIQPPGRAVSTED